MEPTSKGKVLRVYPKAEWFLTTTSHVEILSGFRFLGKSIDTILVAEGGQEGAIKQAWDDAASRLPVAPPSTEPEYPCCQRCLKPTFWTGAGYAHKYPGECKVPNAKPSPAQPPAPPVGIILTVSKLTAFVRAFRGYCPRCNSDAPAIDTCKACENWRGAFPPPEWLAATWLMRHFEPEVWNANK